MKDRNKPEEQNIDLDEPLNSTVADIASEIIDKAPEVQQHVIDAHDQQVSDDERDSENNVYDPAIHADPPSKTAAGRWRRKRAVKNKVGVSDSVVGSLDRPSTSATSEADVRIAQAHATGTALAHITFTLGRAVGGEEWQPIVDLAHGVDEPAVLTAAYTQYCIAKDVKDIPPGVSLCFALIAYAAPRFTMPQTQSRLSNLKKWLYTKWVEWRTNRLSRGRAKVDNLEA